RAPGDEPLDLLAQLPRRRGRIPARDAFGGLPTPGGVLAALPPVAPVEQEIHRRRAGRARQRADGEATADAGTTSVPHENSLLVTFVLASSMSSSPRPDSTLLVAYSENALIWPNEIAGGNDSSCCPPWASRTPARSLSISGPSYGCQYLSGDREN